MLSIIYNKVKGFFRLKTVPSLNKRRADYRVSKIEYSFTFTFNF